MAEITPRGARLGVAVGIVLILIAAVSLKLILTRDPESVAPISRPTVSLTVVGDFGTGGRAERAVAQTMHDWVDEHAVDGLVTTGDNFYPRGDPQYFMRAWDIPYGWAVSTRLEIVASLGNHDFEYRGGASVVSKLKMPGLWYQKSLGDADLFVLDANRVADPAQTRWLADHLRDSDARWQIAVFHHAAYSCSEHGSTPEIVESWVPLFENGGVDLVLNGHDHNYQRFEAEGSPTYVVTGGGGASLYDLEDCDFDSPDRIEADDEKYHFVAVEGDESRLRVRAIASDGEILDDFEVLPRG
jgi:hypothetical protein